MTNCILPSLRYFDHVFEELRDRNRLRAMALNSSNVRWRVVVILCPAVLPIRSLFSSLFGSRFLSSNQHSKWGAAANARCCGGQGLPFTGARASDRQEPAGTRRALQIHWKSGPAIHGKPLRHRDAAAIHFWPGYSTLLRAAPVPLQPSTCCHRLVIPPQPRDEACSRNRGRAKARCQVWR